MLIKIIADPLMHPNEVEEIPTLRLTFIDFLQDYYPDGFGGPVVVLKNRQVVELDDYDFILNEEDEVVIAGNPMGPAAPYIAQAVIAIAVSYALNYLADLLFPPPKVPGTSSSDLAGASVYGLNAQQNETKTGSLVPVSYGRVRVYPSLIAAPYHFVEGGEYYLMMLMSVGGGRYEVTDEDVYIAETQALNYGADNVLFKFTRSEDFTTFPDYDTAMQQVFGDYFRSVVYSAPEAASIELKAAGTEGGQSFLGTYPLKFEAPSTIKFYNPALCNTATINLSNVSVGDQLFISGHNSHDGTYTVSSTGDNLIVVSESFSASSSRSFTGTISHQPYTSGSGKIKFSPAASFVDGDIVSYSGMSGSPLDGKDSLFYDYDTSSDTVDIYCTTLPSEDVDYAGASASASYNTAQVSVSDTENWYGWYTVNPAYTRVDKVIFNIVYPAGLYVTLPNGGIYPWTHIYDIELQQIDDEGLDVAGGLTTKNVEIVEVTPDGFYTSIEMTGLSGRYKTRLKINKGTRSFGSYNVVDSCQIADLTGYRILTREMSFGDITVMAARFKASKAISGAAQLRVNVWAERVDELGNNIETLPDVITDIYTNSTYGYGLDSSALELATDFTYFNGAFENPTTVLEAMQSVGRIAQYNIFLDGSNVVMKKNQAQTLATMLFNETNIIKDSLSVSYGFDDSKPTDGYQITYRDSLTWDQRQITCPATSIMPEKGDLFGSTDCDQVKAYARLLHNQKKYNRKVITFDTELEGHIPQFGDLIQVGHYAFDWGFGGIVTEVAGKVVSIEGVEDAVGDRVVFRNIYGGSSVVYECTVTDSNTITLTETPDEWINQNELLEPTKFHLGTATNFLTQWVVSKIKPTSQTTVRVEAVNYDERVYDDSLVCSDCESSIDSYPTLTCGTDGPISHYKFEESVDIGGGDYRYLDECGNYHATFYYTDIASGGVSGNYVKSATTANWFNVGRNFMSVGSGAWAVSFWAISTHPENDETFWSSSNLASAGSLLCNDEYIMFWDYSATPRAVSWGKLDPVVWKHIAISFDPAAGTLKAWLNGVLKGTAVFSIGQKVTQSFEGSFFIRDGGSGTYGYEGGIDELRIYDRPLTDGDVALLANEF